MNGSSSNRWRHCQLGDLFKVKHGFAFDGAFFTSEGDYILLTPGNFCDEGGFKLKDKEKYFVGDIPRDYVLDKGDLIVAMTEQAEGLLGSSALIPASNRFLHNQRLGKIVEWKVSEIDIRFLFYLFNSRSVRAQIRGSASGTKVRHTSPTRVYEVKVSIPCVTTQRKIASILSAYDDLIENNTRRIAILEEMAQAIYREWFVNFRFPGHENVKLVDSPLGRVPEGWAATMADYGKVVTGKTPSKNKPENFGGEIPFIKTPDMHGNLFCISTNETLSKAGMQSQPSQTVPSNSVCISCIGTVGVISVTTRTSQTNQQINTIIPKLSHWREFIVHSLRSAVPRLRQIGAAGATMDNISKGKLMSFPVLLPPNEILDRFSYHASPLFDRIRVLQRQSSILRSARDLLLPKLISGQLDVEDLDIDLGSGAIEQKEAAA